MTSIRLKIRQIISEISPLDDLEQEHIRFVLDWIDSGAEIFRLQKPSIPKIHLVSYFMIASPTLDRVLLVDHKMAGMWLPAGGHIEPDEDPQETVRREAGEELGIEAVFVSDEPMMVTVRETNDPVGKHTDVSLWYLLKVDPENVLDFDLREFHQIRWFGFDEIPYGNADPHLGRFIRKMASRINVAH